MHSVMSCVHDDCLCPVPDSCIQPSEALQVFTTRFEQRYGAMHPLFYIGSLKDAVREATSGVGNVSKLWKID